MKRRQFLLAGAATVAAGATIRPAAAAEGDGTPAQFAPKAPKDPAPLENELEKYRKCPYCGMDRAKFHYSRHLVVYVGDLVDGTCSLHCAAVSLSLNLPLIPKAVYAPDNGSGEPIKPMIDAETATYVIGGDHKAVMTRIAKTSFGSLLAAEAAKGAGELADFQKALNLTYCNMADDMKMMRDYRIERQRRRAAEAQGGKKE